MKFSCVDCMKKPCRTHDLDQLPKGCPTAECDPEKVFAIYSEEERKLLREAAAVERIGYGRHTRVEEIMHFCHRMGYQKIGVAFCSGFSSEKPPEIRRYLSIFACSAGKMLIFSPFKKSRASQVSWSPLPKKKTRLPSRLRILALTASSV